MRWAAVNGAAAKMPQTVVSEDYDSVIYFSTGKPAPFTDFLQTFPLLA
jgi:hypothetical protein